MAKKVRWHMLQKAGLILGLCFLCIGLPSLHAQYNIKENNVWAFGRGAGLDFNSGSAVPITTAQNTGAGNSVEAAASVCDPNGTLLFYTNGARVWDRNNTVMPNNNNSLHGLGTGDDEMTRNTTQGALIVPMPDDPDKYYIFSLTSIDDQRSVYSGRLFYSVVDMSLRNGMGDVVPGRMWQPLDSTLSEKMIAIPGACNNIWVLVHAVDTNQFKAYEITPAGLNTTPVSSYTGATGYGPFTLIGGRVVNAFYSVGQLVAAPNGKKLAAGWSLGGNFVAMYDFDPATGTVSNDWDLQQGGFYGVAFSADNSKLYVADYNSIYQYNMNAGSPPSITSSRVKIGDCNATGLRLAPDGKIYFRLKLLSDFLGCIADPNQSGAACQYTPNAIQMQGVASGYLTFGTDVVTTVKPDNNGKGMVHSDTFSCEDTHVTLRAPAGQQRYQWDDGTQTRTRDVSLPGTYWVRSITNCTMQVDTFKVYQENALSFSLGKDTIICNADRFQLQAPDIANASYLWQDGQTGRSYTVTQSGIYRLQIRQGSCTASDTIRVSMIDVRQHLGPDTAFCTDDEINLTLQARTDAGAHVLWSDGSSLPALTVTREGTYFVTVTDSGCSGSDTIKIGREVCDCTLSFPSAFSPNGDGLNDVFLPVKNSCQVAKYQLNIFNRYGQLVFQSADPDRGWDGRFNGVAVDAGVYMYEARFESGSRKNNHSVKGDITLIR